MKSPCKSCIQSDIRIIDNIHCNKPTQTFPNMAYIQELGKWMGQCIFVGSDHLQNASDHCTFQNIR